MCVSVCLCPCVCWFLSPVKSVWGVWGIIGTWLGKGMLYFEFHAPLHAISCNFGYFSHFLANFNMLGIKMHVLELRNSMVILPPTFAHSLMQFPAIFMQFHAILAISAIFWPISTCWVSKCMYLSWKIQWWRFQKLPRTLSRNFTQFSSNFGFFSHFLANVNMLGP